MQGAPLATVHHDRVTAETRKSLRMYMKLLSLCSFISSAASMPAMGLSDRLPV